MRDPSSSLFRAQDAVALTERGLVCGNHAVLARFSDHRFARRRLDENDEGRLLALLSVIAGEPVDPSLVLPAVKTAAEYWRSGDKALANLRLIFARLPRAKDADSLRHLGLAADLLDGGMAPDELTKALWPWSRALDKYNRDQPRKPAGVDGAGEWTFGDGGQSSGEPQRQIVVAATDQNKTSPEQDLLYDEHRMFGQETLEEDVEHGRPIDPTNQTPVGALGVDEAEELIAGGMRGAIDTVGPGRGPQYGTRVHMELKARMKALGREDINPEQSFKDGKRVEYGTKGSVRTDVGVGPKNDPHTIFDAKTGGARLTTKEIEAYKRHLPQDGRINVRELR